MRPHASFVGSFTRLVRQGRCYLVRSTLGAHHRDADGPWGGGWCDADPSHRQLVTLSLRQLEQGPAFMVVDAKDTAWGGEEDLGEPMRREARSLARRSLARSSVSSMQWHLQDQRVHGWRLQAPRRLIRERSQTASLRKGGYIGRLKYERCRSCSLPNEGAASVRES